MSWKSIRVWLYGLIYSTIGGAANAIVLYSVDENARGNPALLWKFAGFSAIVSAALYLKQSPLPPDD